MDHKRTEHRELETIKEPDKIRHVVERYLKDTPIYLKGFDPPYQVKITGIDDHNVVSVHMGEYEPQMGEELVLFRILGRYFELAGKALEATGQGNVYRVAVTRAAIAKKERSFLRIPVKRDEAHISNVRASKHTIDATLYSIPTSVKVNFGTVEQQLKNEFEDVKIDVFGKRGTILDEVRRTGDSLLVTDTQSDAAYDPAMPEGFIDYREFLDGEVREQMMKYQREKVKSEAIVPVTYISHDETAIPLGYIQARSRTGDPLDIDTVLRLREIAFEMVDRIRDSNTVLIQEKQQVLNVSRGGLRVLIDHPDLKEYIVRQNGFTFDLFFKMQAPITLYGLIRSAYTTKMGELILGVQLSGSSSRDGEIKRFLDNISQMENRLREAIASRKGKG